MAVRFLLDEDTERTLAVILECEGFGVERVVSCETLGPGSSDDEVRAVARETDAVVLTHDADFVDGRHRRTPPTVFYAPTRPWVLTGSPASPSPSWRRSPTRNHCRRQCS